MGKETGLKAALNNTFISTIGQMTTCNVKRVAYTDDPLRLNIEVPLSYSERFSLF